MDARYRALIAHVEACRARGRLADAEDALRDIVALNPREHFAWSLLGLVGIQRGDPAAGEEALRRALAADRGNAQYLNLLGVALGEQGQLDAAQAALRKALKQRPAFAEAHYNLGKALEKSGDLPAAQSAYRRAAAIDPRYPGATYMYARSLFLAGDAAQAEHVLESGDADEWNLALLGKAKAATRGPDASIGVYREAVARLPESGMLWRQLAHALLASGDWRAGWDAYARRDFPGRAPRSPLPSRLPADLGGRTLRLLPEQGLGDILFFLRFVPAAAARGARVEVVAPAKLAPLLAGQPDISGICTEGDVERGDPAGVALTIADLPYVLDADAPAASLALSVPETRTQAWRSRLAAAGPPPYRAVCWRAGTDFRRQPEFGGRIQSLFKEVPPDALGRALKGLGGTVVCVQRAPDERERNLFETALGAHTLDAAGANDDLVEAAALLSAVDDYVGVSNTNTHLRAAVRGGGRTLVPFPAEWRWMDAGTPSPWFPAFQILRQRPDRDWRPALDALRAALASPEPSGSIDRIP